MTVLQFTFRFTDGSEECFKIIQGLLKKSDNMQKDADLKTVRKTQEFLENKKVPF